MKLAEQYLKQMNETVDKIKSFDDMESIHDLANELSRLEKLGLKKTAAMLDETRDYSWFPSLWDDSVSFLVGKSLPYPAFLAEALCLSKAAEPLTDLANAYYAKRKYSKEALEVFKKYALKAGNKIANNYTIQDQLENDEDFGPQLEALIDKDPAFMKKWIMTALNQKEIDKLKQEYPEAFGWLK